MGETIASIGLVTSPRRFYAREFPQSDATTRASPPKSGGERGGARLLVGELQLAPPRLTLNQLSPSPYTGRPAANRRDTNREKCSSLLVALSTLTRCGSKCLWSHARRKSNKEEGKGGTYIWTSGSNIFRSKTMARGRRKHLVAFFRYLSRFWVTRFLLSLSLSLFRRDSSLVRGRGRNVRECKYTLMDRINYRDWI